MKANSDPMYKNHKNADFTEAKPVAAVPALAMLQAETGGKTRITMRLDNDVLAVFKARAEMTGGSSQTLINDALKQVATGQTLAEVVRKTIREELRAA